jgi:hypothetical protein
VQGWLVRGQPFRLWVRIGADALVLLMSGGEQRISQIWVACHYGGKKAYFARPRCAAQRMGLHSQGGRFDCRKCQRLEHEPVGYQGFWREDKIKRKLADRYGEGCPDRKPPVCTARRGSTAREAAGSPGARLQCGDGPVAVDRAEDPAST